ncbi:hypothetical protein D3C85_1322800 [compost metagenome]
MVKRTVYPVWEEIKEITIKMLHEYKSKTYSIKPILRPLSDILKDENFDLYMDLCDELGLTQCEHLLKALDSKNYYAFDIQKYEILEEWMNKNHFDWKHDLIGERLAIDINTL